jgi:hypothetical protein
MTAIKKFHDGEIVLPSSCRIINELKNTKYKLLPGDEMKGYKLLPIKFREAFEDYELSINELIGIDEMTAMDIFVNLQGGRSLNKAEIRAALGGKLCDFVTELTYKSGQKESKELLAVDKANSTHLLFTSYNKNHRKEERSLCDILLHEYLYPRKDKHWGSLETMYLDKSQTLTEIEKNGFRQSINRFYNAITINKRNVLQSSSMYLVLSYYMVWKELTETFSLPTDFDFTLIIQKIEKDRRINIDNKVEWVKFDNALSNSGYAKNKIDIRHTILMSEIFIMFPSLVPKDRQRLFTESQKISIYERANHQCEWEENGTRCQEIFNNFHTADADHIIKWNEGGPTSFENGRLLCPKHNRGRR